MRGVMRKVLADAALAGRLPGDHHFTISFRTRAPGVKISSRLAEQWPHEMTIILQHQYSNLVVDERGFSVCLSFRSIPEQLYVPFEAVTVFSDPSVEFGLKWEVEEASSSAPRDETPAPFPTRPPGVAAVPSAPKPAKAAERAAPEGEEEAKIVSIDAFRKKT
ncbi:SspB family protein [Methylosinus sp. 3S-1]